MIYRTLGQSTLEVSAISFGCMSLGEDEAFNTRLLHQAHSLGINYFDTADLYQHGRNELFVGKALKDRRDKVILATKVGNQWRADGSGWDWNPHKHYIKAAVHQSLRRLQTDYIDLYQLHGGTVGDPIEETIEAFEELVQEGYIRHYGLSSIRPNVIREYLQRSNIISNMMQYSLLDRRPEETCLDMIHDKGVSVIVRGAVAKGLLAGKAPQPYLNHSTEAVFAAQQLLQPLSTSLRSPAQTALLYCLAHPAVATIACGISREEQLLENVRTMEAPPLTEVEMSALQEGVKAYVYEEHRWG
ncbi:MAG: aldo/keto reductase [Phaeodactylibacter sp.]|nr:aldo/keto reductase [Phaeodactylibacter sp.]